MKFKMVHECYNVRNLEASLTFYQKALGLTEKCRKIAEDGSFILMEAHLIICEVLHRPYCSLPVDLLHIHSLLLW